MTPKDDANAPKEFTDCAKLYSECRAPNEHPIGVNKKRKQSRNRTTTPTYSEETTNEIDPVTKYVQQRKK